MDAQYPRCAGVEEADTGLLNSDDVTLAMALTAGDSRAPRVAWMRFQPVVYRILRRTFGPRHDIEDVQQDIFLAFFRKVPGLRDPAALKGFMMSIVAHTIKYQLRRVRASRFICFWESTDSAQKIDPAYAEVPDDAARHTLAAFYAVLDKLSAHDRTLFALRFLEGMELVVVAKTMGMSVSTAKRHLARVRKRVVLRIRNEPALAADRRVAANWNGRLPPKTYWKTPTKRGGRAPGEWADGGKPTGVGFIGQSTGGAT